MFLIILKRKPLDKISLETNAGCLNVHNWVPMLPILIGPHFRISINALVPFVCPSLQFHAKISLRTGVSLSLA